MSQSNNLHRPQNESPRGTFAAEYPGMIINPSLRWEHGDVCSRKEHVMHWSQNNYTFKPMILNCPTILRNIDVNSIVFTASNTGNAARKLIVPDKKLNIQHEYSYIESPANSPTTITYYCLKNRRYCGSYMLVNYEYDTSYYLLDEHEPECAVPFNPDIKSTEGVIFFDGRPHIPVPKERVAAFSQAMETIYLRPIDIQKQKTGMFYRFIFQSQRLHEHAQYRCQNCHSTLNVHCKKDHTIELHEHSCHEQCLTTLSDAEAVQNDIKLLTYSLETASITKPLTTLRKSVVKNINLKADAAANNNLSQDDNEVESKNNDDSDYLPGRKKRRQKKPKNKVKR
uniref:C2H2-type domain-containing protein n=2 Tax=Panagrellus redivivus TaxID=6233 RepID=A0A7E4VGK8_PANRE